MVKKMIETGYRIKIFDNKIKLNKIFGSNKSYLEEMIPTFDSLFSTNLDSIILECPIIIIANDDMKIDKSLKKYSSRMIIRLSDLSFSK